MTAEQVSGQRIVRFGAFTLALGAIVSFIRLGLVGPASLSVALLSLASGFALAWCLFLGLRWPRWVLLGLLVLGTVGLLMNPSMAGPTGIFDTLLTLAFVILVSLLFALRSVREYYRREQDIERRLLQSIR